jgi:heme exporter protein C
MQRWANPTRFLRIATAVRPWVTSVCALCILPGLALGLVFSPPDYQQGDTVRIMYVHVPAAWMALFVYSAMATASAVGLIWRHPLADIAAKASAPIGACFTAIALITGSIWGQPTWGTWWVWDARLTSVLVLLFLYLGYIALWEAIDDPQRAARAAAILALVGFVNVPIVKFSVDWWNTLHQPASVLTTSGPTIHTSMLVPLLLMAVGFTLFYASVVLVRIEREIVARRIRALRLLASDAAAAE